MKKVLFIFLYILLFTAVSILISQLPSIIKSEALFQDTYEMVLCIIAGVVCGAIAGFFSPEKKEADGS